MPALLFRPVCFAALLATASVSAGSLDSMAWLAGCWSREGAEPGSGEYWLPPAGGRMLGIGRTVRGGRTVEHEFLELEETADATLVYTAMPARQARTAFPATRLTDASVVFENANHDFPQRIIYTQAGTRKMTVRIEGERSGGLRSAEFRFVKMSCPP